MIPRAWMILATLLIQNEAAAQQPTALRDPHERDEDISATTVTVTASRSLDGLYEYAYDVVSPSTNLGIVMSFYLDIACRTYFGEVDPSLTYHYAGGEHGGGHVPMRPEPGIHSNSGKAGGNPRVSVDYELGWTTNLAPGQSIRDLRVVSPAPPGPRSYRLSVSMYTDDVESDGTGWDYRTYEDDDTVPWIPDFEVDGVITGPECALDSPHRKPTPARFAGTTGFEPEAINDLLTYSAPLRDRFHVASNASSVSVKVHYAPDIDPKTFAVDPSWARALFTPTPGKSETVVLPVKHDKNLFRLEVHQASAKQPVDRDTPYQPHRDRDVFEIRRDPAPAAGSSRGR